MASTAEIMNMLDWHMPPEIQAKGRELAKKVKQFFRFCNR